MSAVAPVHVIGAGGHAKVVISTLLAAGHAVKAVFDDDPGKWGTSILGVPVMGPAEEILQPGSIRAVNAVGNNAARKALVQRLQGVEWVAVIHPRAYVDPSVRIGEGTVVFAGAVIQPDTTIGAHAIVNTGATVDHDCTLEDYVHVAPGCHVAGGALLKEGVLLGIGGAAAPGVTVGSWTVVGAGGVVVYSLPPGIVAVGIPAKPLKDDGAAGPK